MKQSGAMRGDFAALACSKAMAALGVGTVRAAALVTSASTVGRSPDGEQTTERCAAVRAPSEGFKRLRKEGLRYIFSFLICVAVCIAMVW